MRARDGDAQAHHAQQLTEHLSARNDWNLQRAGACDFGIGEFHRRGNHHRVQTLRDVIGNVFSDMLSNMIGNMIGMMALENLHAQCGEPLGGGAKTLIASAHREAEPERQLGDTAHAGAADADEMQAALTAEQSPGESFTHAAARSPRAKLET